MMQMKQADLSALVSARFRGDVELFTTIQKDSDLSEEQKRLDVMRKRSRLRMRFLATAVRVSKALLPTVAASVEQLASRVDLGKPLEVFVYAEGSINAHVAETGSRFLVGLSSGAVQTLTSAELEYVIGHELAHALYGHTELAVGHLVENPRFSDKSKLLRAWERAAEISADRMGLLCCGDLEVATTALVKTLSGLPLPGVRVNPSDISGQWDSLLEELMDDGAAEVWENSHPFPPLRIKALEAYWNNRGPGSDNGDGEIRRLLSVMDSPERSRSADEAPLQDGGGAVLARFMLWGGLYVGLADGTLAPAARTRLEALTVPGVNLETTLAAANVSPAALEQFKAARATRRVKLKATELSAIMKQLISFATLDGRISPAERTRLSQLAKELGLVDQAVELLIQQHQNGAAR